jgi:hypothetical protein
MIRFMDGTEGRHVGIVVDGKVTEEDVKTLASLLEEAIGKHGRLRVLLRLESLGGVEPKAFLEDVRFSIEHLRDFERAALVGGQAWLGAYAAVADRLFPCEVRTFDPDRQDEAWRWLRSPQGV